MPFDDDDDAGGGLERGRLTEREIYGALTTDLEDIPSAGFSPCREQERECVHTGIPRFRFRGDSVWLPNLSVALDDDV